MYEFFIIFIYVVLECPYQNYLISVSSLLEIAIPSSVVRAGISHSPYSSSVGPGPIRHTLIIHYIQSLTPKLTPPMKRTQELKQCHVTGLRRRFYNLLRNVATRARERQWEDRNPVLYNQLMVNVPSPVSCLLPN